MQIELRDAVREAGRLREQDRREQERALPRLIAGSSAMASVMKLMERVATSDANVLVTGEHGTGKDVVARWLHAASTRVGKAFVPVNAGALADGVFESELFGHVKGAFTDAKTDRIGCFELADGGTLFLDEIGTMPTGQQAKLLRLLQTGEFSPVGSSRTRQADVRVISATNADIGKEVVRGAFREDPLYRLNTVEIRLPPLRDRGDDIVALASAFLDASSCRSSRRSRKARASASCSRDRSSKRTRGSSLSPRGPTDPARSRGSVCRCGVVERSVRSCSRRRHTRPSANTRNPWSERWRFGASTPGVRQAALDRSPGDLRGEAVFPMPPSPAIA
jgi:transcriptional regulator with GAF, ATPase, and Fis domain